MVGTYSTVVEVYDTSDDPVYIEGSAIADALSCSIKPNLNKPGTFTFTVPAIKGFTKAYDDIGMNYKVLFYMGEGTLSTDDLLMVGKIQRITSGGSSQNGFIRSFEGKDLGEVLDRTFKYNKNWQATNAEDIVAEVANDAGLYNAAKIASDTTDITLNVRTETYQSILQKVGDYWYDGSNKVQKDFYVDTDGELNWVARPLRTVGVESLVFGTDFLDYNLTYDLLPSKNYITVYGAPTAFLPNDQDFWTEDADDLADNWQVTSGSGGLTLSNSLTPEVGSYHLLCTDADTSSPYAQAVQFARYLGKLTLRNIQKLHFHYYPGRSNPAMTFTTNQVRLLAPDSSNYFYLTLTGSPDTWTEITSDLGTGNEYDAGTNPNGWHLQGSPNWWLLMGIEWYANSSGNSGSIVYGIDGLYFYPERWSGTAENATNQGIYGLREAEYTDENLLSDTECERRAQSLLMQLKEKTVSLTCTTDFNANILLGDRIPVTISHDNLTALDMDVVSVEHKMVNNQFTTSPSLIYSADIRALPPQSTAEALSRHVQNLRAVTSELYTRVVR